MEFNWNLWFHLQHWLVQFSVRKTVRDRKTPALFACSMKLEAAEAEALKPVGFVEPKIQLFFFKNQVFHIQPNYMTSTPVQCSVARNMLILASSSWKTLVSMVNLGGYQYLQANSQRKEILQLYMTTCLYRLKAIKSLLNWAPLSSDHSNDFQTVFRKLVEANFLHLQDTTVSPL